MSYQERGIFPANPVSRERPARLPYREIWGQRDAILKERGLEIVDRITSTFIIDQKGNARIFREFRGRVILHSFKSLPDALDQIERVIQEKLGFQRKIGEVFIDIHGDNQDLVEIGSLLLHGADEYYNLPFELRKAYARSLAKEAESTLKGKRNIYKKEAFEVLQKILESKDEFQDDAKQLIRSGKNAFDGAISGVKIVNGETIRLVDGQIYFEFWGNVSQEIYKSVASYYGQLQDLNQKADKGESLEDRKTAEIDRKKLTRTLERKFKEDGSFWKAISQIKANPFFKRFNSSSVKNLIRLPWALSTSRFKNAEKLLAKAVTELSALERDYERGRIRLLQEVSTSKP